MVIALTTASWFVPREDTTIVCPSAAATTRAAVLVGQNVAGVGVITAANTDTLTLSEILTNPFLIRNQTRIRDFKIIADTKTNTESFYHSGRLQDFEERQFPLRSALGLPASLWQ